MTAQQAQTGAASFFSIQDKLAAIIYLLNTNAMTAQQLQTAAACYQCIEDKLGAVIYLLANGAGGVSAGAAIYVKNYAGVTPTDIPLTGNATAFDTSNGAIWAYNGTVWTQFVT